MLIFSKSGKVRQIQGNYSDYLESEAEDEKAAAEAAAAAKTIVEQTKKKPGLTHQEKKDLETIEARIAATEKDQEKAEQAMLAASSSGRFEAVKEANQTFAAKQKEVADLYARWEWLEAKQRGEV
jgi:ABC transport system ATP-binding/permease protein